jgi:hypothetical protein
MILIVIYLFIIIICGLLLCLITKYLKEKPFGTQFVTDHLCGDLAVNVFCAVTLTSTIIIAREVYGPFDENAIKVILALQQLTTAAIVTTILSIQIGKFCDVFFAAR